MLNINKKLNFLNSKVQINQPELIRILSVIDAEFRTSLNTVLGLSQLLKNQQDTELKDYSRLMYEACKHMLPLLDYCNYVLELQNNKQGPQRVPFNLCHSLEQLIVKHYEESPKDSILIQFNYQADAPTRVIGELDHLNTVINLLLEDALRFSRDKKIEMAVYFDKKSNSNFNIKISDHGEGIATENLAGICDLFAPEQSDYHNSGLRLSICKQILNYLGGNLIIETDEHQGTVYSVSLNLQLQNNQDNFEYSFLHYYKDKINILVLNDNDEKLETISQTLPFTNRQITTSDNIEDTLRQAYQSGDIFQVIILTDDMLAQHTELFALLFLKFPKLAHCLFLVFATDPNQKVLRMLKSEACVGVMSKPMISSKIMREFSYNWLYFKNQQHDSQSSYRYLETEDRSKANILLIEENEDSQCISRGLLETLGCQVDIATSAQEAIDLIKMQKEYDLVLLDIGLSTAQKSLTVSTLIKQTLSKEYDLPIIALTSSLTDDKKANYFKAGINEMLNKPIFMKDLKTLLHQYIPAVA